MIFVYHIPASTIPSCHDFRRVLCFAALGVTALRALGAVSKKLPESGLWHCQTSMDWSVKGHFAGHPPFAFFIFFPVKVLGFPTKSGKHMKQHREITWNNCTQHCSLILIHLAAVLRTSFMAPATRWNFPWNSATLRRRTSADVSSAVATMAHSRSMRARTSGSQRVASQVERPWGWGLWGFEWHTETPNIRYIELSSPSQIVNSDKSLLSPLPFWGVAMTYF